MPVLIRRESLFAGALTLCLLQTLLPGSARAQSAYTMTVLNKPLGVSSYLPTSLDNRGVVRGGVTYVAGYAPDPFASCFLFCPTFLGREVSWPASANPSVSGTLGLRGFFSAMGNDRGTQVGRHSMSPSQTRETLVPSVLNMPTAAQVPYDYRPDSIRSGGGTPTPLPRAGDIAWLGRAINASDAVAGTGEFKAANGYPVYVPIVLRQGQVTRLPVGAHTSGEASGINDQGTVVGSVTDDPAVDRDLTVRRTRPAMWVDNQLREIGGAELQWSRAIAINNAGQVLLRSEPAFPATFSESHVWRDGMTTKITGPAGHTVHAMAINDQGTVVGCTRAPGEWNTLKRTDATAFIWRDGVMRDLAQELAGKGVKLPAGTKLGCPTAINSQGSILAYHYRLNAPDTLTWVRFNAKP